jgi:hypothetical protein
MHKVVARKDKNICTGDEKLVNRALSKAERKTKSEKTKKRTRTTSYSSDGLVEDIFVNKPSNLDGFVL